tara:strand:- start:200 stop:550 length:351 start_codon:yes stop_codon:yes gene_type:complete
MDREELLSAWLLLGEAHHRQDLGEAERVEADVANVALQLRPLHEEGQRLGVLDSRGRRLRSSSLSGLLLFDRRLGLHEEGRAAQRHGGARELRRRAEAHAAGEQRGEEKQPHLPAS